MKERCFILKEDYEINNKFIPKNTISYSEYFPDSETTLYHFENMGKRISLLINTINELPELFEEIK